MRMPGWRWPKQSLRIQLSISVLVMTLPLVGMLLYNNFYAIDVVRGQVADSYKNTLAFYMNQTDAGLSDIDSYMNTLAGGPDVIALDLAVQEADYYMAKVYLYNKLSRDINLYPKLSSFFVYAADRRDYVDIPIGDMTYQESERYKEYMIDLVERQATPIGLGTKRWRHTAIDESHILLNIVKAGDVYLGAWIHTEQLLAPLQSLKLAEGGRTLLATDEGVPLTDLYHVKDQGIVLKSELDDYYLSGFDKRYLIVGKNSNRGNFSLFALIPDKSVLAKLPYLQQLVWLVTLAAIFFIPIGLFLMRRAILVPLGRVLIAMKKIRSGDWGVRVKKLEGSDEFVLLGNSFNAMMDEIQTLRINVYEEQLSKQKEELQRLQLQVNPHFFLNSLNIVYNLAKVKNYSLIMEMTLALIQFFRYLFRSNTSFVKLKDELEHTRNYLKIQSLRFPDKLTWNIDAPVYLSEIPIPPLIIQSFVENSIKHAVTLEEPAHIGVQIRFGDEESGSTMEIQITDTGRGFSLEVLEALQAGRSVENELGEHTGIWNVQRRLRLLYREASSIQFYNDPKAGGATVIMNLPTHTVKEEQA
jgi:two-component system sensor histidine kinase YesM